MASEAEPAKTLLPYLQRADELQKHEPLISYYCRLYAMERGLRIPQSERTKTTSALLISLMKQLEKDKKSLTLTPDDHLHLEGFASNVFAKADKQDRAGKADLNTAKTFYAASIFFEVLNQFGALEPDLEQKQKYAIWKAADIRKAIKEGRKPVPGPPGGEKDLSNTSTSEYDIEPTTNNPPESHLSSQSFNRNDSQNFTNNFASPPHSAMPPPPPPSNTQPPPPSNFPPPSSAVPPPTYSFDDYPSNNFQDNPNYSQNYHHPSSFPQEPQHQNYPPHDPSYTYTNFQTYPSFSETTLPAAYSPSATRPTDYPSTGGGQYTAGGGNAAVPVPAGAGSSGGRSYEYDSSYQPPVANIAEALKAARFAVGSLAFDEVPVAVEFLKKALELLTNPSASV
ncbi:hypothetical protein L2E82_37982 [Cichorium intybus]|uniref:Uncharacterized protein n=1 Tax=Cichorium intybus TaxID=13427 RepID=A0ACB9AH16_CICIN|nr:hypothetical protein L2E82_37982 [Cichorium intybus]